MALSLDLFTQLFPAMQVSHSKEFFPEVESLIKIGFVPILATDIYIDTSFHIPWGAEISGALIQTFTKDNVIDSNFICYKIPLSSEYMTDLPLSITLATNKNQLLNLGRNFIKTIPWLPFIIFNLLFLLLPASINSVFVIINILWIVVITLYYLWSFARFMFKYINEKSVFIKGQKVNYENAQDLLVLWDNDMKALLPLIQLWIHNAVIYQQSLYFKQSVLEQDIIATIKNLTSDPWIYEQRLFMQTKSILEYITSQQFVSDLFWPKKDGGQEFAQ